MRTLRVLLASLLCLSCEGRADVPLFTGASLPVPPMQGKPWTPPATTLPQLAPLLADIDLLFSFGIADPRGCAYREIEVVVGDSTGGEGRVIRTHGWVLPSGEGAKFGAAWNGLVYPLVSAGKEADLRADVGTMLARAQGRAPWGGHAEAVAEAISVSIDHPTALRMLLLLRLGEGSLAEKLWPVTGLDEMRLQVPNSDFPEARYKAQFIGLASDVLWAAFDRAVGAHRRGDDRLAAVDCRALVAAPPRVDAEAVRREIYSAKDAVNHEWGRGASMLSFLSEVSRLLADSDRRIAEAPYVPVLSEEERSQASLRWIGPGTKEMKPKGKGDAARIAALIRDLELVSASQNSQPGSVELYQDGIVQALVAEGEDAVEPLLDCMERDTRLVRSVGYHRNFFRHRHVLGVGDAAYAALGMIIEVNFFQTGVIGDEPSKHGAGDRAELVARIRAYWKAYGGLPLEQRWYRILTNPDVSEELWWQTMGRVIQPANVARIDSGSATVTHVDPAKGRRPLRGEPLRAMTNPSISDLLAGRLDKAEARLAAAKDEVGWKMAMREVAGVAKALAIWDGKGRGDAVRDAGRKLLDGFTSPPPFVVSKEALGEFIEPLSGFFGKASESDDAAVLEMAAAWLAKVAFTSGYSVSEAFEIAWTHADAPAMRRTMAALSADGGPLSPPWTARGPGWRLCASRLLVFPEFRAAVVRGLARKEGVGTVEVRDDGYSVETPVLAGWYSNRAWARGSLPPAGTKVSIRYGDACAFLLSELPVLPPFPIAGSVEERDKALAAYAAFLSRKDAVLSFPARW